MWGLDFAWSLLNSDTSVFYDQTILHLNTRQMKHRNKTYCHLVRTTKASSYIHDRWFKNAPNSRAKINTTDNIFVSNKCYKYIISFCAIIFPHLSTVVLIHFSNGRYIGNFIDSKGIMLLISVVFNIWTLNNF